VSRTPGQQAGDEAETIVADRLVAQGWTILGRHVHVGRAELDLLAVDPGPPAALVVVEVRRRSRRDFGLAEETVDRRKQLRLWSAGCVLRDAGCAPDGTRIPHHPLRVDLVAVEPSRDGSAWLTRHHRWLGRR
jgi:Holliday junction resolvase-like predicted endonuclease